MPLDVDSLSKQPGKLRKSLKKLKKDASVTQVHQLRTRTRRLEAMLHALHLDSNKNERGLLKALKGPQQCIDRKSGDTRNDTSSYWINP